MTSFFSSHPLLKIFNGALVDLPRPKNISLWWNFGSLLGLCLRVQLVTGILLAIQYTRSSIIAFESVTLLEQDVTGGWIWRLVHANGARFFFICLYIHIARGIYNGSYLFQETWGIGVIIFLLVIGAAFLGYVLPWGQISFWGAAVITRLLAAIPGVGKTIVIWVWGGFAVGAATLTRFFAFHFLVPFIVARLAIIHLLFLHQTGSRNPLGLGLNNNKIVFHPYFSWKDLRGVFLLFRFLTFLLLINPLILGDEENFILANPIVTPVHIQPEWYFLFAYAILRSIPNKLGGVIALALAVIILLIIPFLPTPKNRGHSWYPFRVILYWLFVTWVLLLTWIGARPAEEPYTLPGQILTVLYFRFYFIHPLIKIWWDSFFN